jgi:predicted ATP-grasp superfamily ATP-dependent carboligase
MAKNITGIPQESIALEGQAGVIVIGGHFQGLGLLRSLGRQNIPVYLLDKEQCIGRFSKYVKKFLKCPDVSKDESRFFEFLVSLAGKENLEGWIIYPNDDETVSFLARYKERLEKYYRISTPPWDIVKYAYDKALTYDIAEKCGVAIPKTCYPESIDELKQIDMEYPVVIKPSIKEPFYRRTSRKAILVKDRDQLIEEYTGALKAIAPSQTLMVQEFIPGGTRNLLSVGCLCRDGKLLARVMACRLRQHPMDFGHATTFAKTVNIPEMGEMAGKIVAATRFHGLAEIEFMYDGRDEQYKLIEINARPWGWHTIAIAAGVDMPYLSYLDMLGQEVRQNGFIEGVKWMHLATDVPTAAIEILKGRLKFKEYVNSFKGKKQYAVWARKDPMPFFAELVLLPYLWIKRGF